MPDSSASPRIVADIGGTNGRFAIVRDGRMTERREYRNAGFPDLASLLRQYLTDAGSADDDVQAACLAVAAPISSDGEARFTNAPWTVSSHALREAMGFERIALINDFAAQAYGLEMLVDDGAEQVAGPRHREVDRNAPRVILGPVIANTTPPNITRKPKTERIGKLPIMVALNATPHTNIARPTTNSAAPCSRRRAEGARRPPPRTLDANLGSSA